MKDKFLSLGIDTSNYKTSLAVVDQEGKVLFNSREFLKVKKGERGLRQSEALFQHIKQLPEAIAEALADKQIRERIGCVAVSTRPRPVEGSYMPVFLAGESLAKSVSAALDVPLYECSHQEGHVEAVKFYSELKDTNALICFHFSGGTTEAVLVDRASGTFEIVGGSKDLAYGQALDRLGVAMGFDFPCGEELDRIAVSCSEHKELLSKIKVNDCFVNLSGIETQAQRLLGTCRDEQLAEDLLFKLSQSVAAMTMQLSSKYNINNFIYAGGVSCSRYMRSFLKENLDRGIKAVFGKPEMSSDNAVGTALLGGKNIWL